MKCDSWASLLAYTFVSLCLGHQPKVKVATSSPTITMAPLEDYVPKKGHRMKQQPKSILAMNGKS
jgi:hypothetical protein